MKTLLEKSIALGLGTLSMTKEKVESSLKELEEKGEVTAAEGKKMLNTLIKKGEEERVALKETVQNQVNEIMRTLGYIGREEFKSMEKRISDLEARLNNRT